jgi:hypothetical protein
MELVRALTPEGELARPRVDGAARVRGHVEQRRVRLGAFVAEPAGEGEHRRGAEKHSAERQEQRDPGEPPPGERCGEPERSRGVIDQLDAACVAIRPLSVAAPPSCSAIPKSVR